MNSSDLIREATKAGSWYVPDKKVLDSQLSDWLSAAEITEADAKNIKAIIGPHAGYSYSGPTAAWAYKYLSSKEDVRVFLLGPCHYQYIKGCGLTKLKAYETPLGNIEIDTETVASLMKDGKFIYTSKEDEEEEHSLEMHLPYIQKIFGGKKFKLVPVMVGQLDVSLQEYYGKIFSPYFDQPNTVFIISSDFCHWGQRFQFDYYEKSDGDIYKSIEKLDKKGMSLIENHDAAGFAKYLADTKNTICGRNPISVLLNTINASSLKLRTKFVKYAQSSQVKTQKDSSVSYASAITFTY